MNERKFINESVKKLLVSEYIRKETESAGFGGMEMKRTPFGTNITLYVNKPGLVIGRHGSKVQAITENLEKKYKLESPQIEVKEIDNPDLNPQVVSKKIALSLEKGWAYRKAGNTSLRRIVENGARGVIITISGKISGERGRMQKFMSGSVKYSGEPARSGMERGFSVAKLKLGAIGVKVGILRNEYKLPDDYSVSEKLGVVTPKLIQEEEPPKGIKIPDRKTPGRDERSRGRPRPGQREREPARKPVREQKKEVAETVKKPEPAAKETPVEVEKPKVKSEVKAEPIVNVEPTKVEEKPVEKDVKEEKKPPAKKKAEPKEDKEKTSPAKIKSTKEEVKPEVKKDENKVEEKVEEDGAKSEGNKADEQ